MTEPLMCDMYDMPVASCSHCRSPQRREVSREVVRRFKARYDGRGACGHSIYEGDDIAFNTDDELLCEECAR